MLERYNQINWIDQCPRAWLSSETHSPRARTSSQDMQQGTLSLVTNSDVSQCVGKLRQVTQKDSGISMLAGFQILAGKGSEQPDQEIGLETSRNPFQPKLCSDSR